jgi:ABC-type xylose transport system permease subunit
VDAEANIKFYIYVVLLLIVAAGLVKVGEVGLFGRGAFLSPDSLINLMRASAPVLTLVGAFTLVMIAGYIDLSVGSAMSLSAVVFAWMILNGFSFIPAFLVTLVVGILMGTLNMHRHGAASRRSSRLVTLTLGASRADRTAWPLRHESRGGGPAAWLIAAGTRNRQGGEWCRQNHARLDQLLRAQ